MTITVPVWLLVLCLIIMTISTVADVLIIVLRRRENRMLEDQLNLMRQRNNSAS